MDASEISIIDDKYGLRMGWLVGKTESTTPSGKMKAAHAAGWLLR
jgi:hypothetical protein